MTAPNHALTGALIGLTVSNPVLALPLAFLSHFVCDLIPHYDPPGDESQRISTKSFARSLVWQAALCGLIVLLIGLTRPQNWLSAVICAFLATSPDLFWIPKFIHAQKTGKTLPNTNWFWRFHVWIQWKTGPKLIWAEAVWFVAFGALLITLI